MCRFEFRFFDGELKSAVRVFAYSGENIVMQRGMPAAFIASPFAGTAPYYDDFRAPHTQAAIDFIIERYSLNNGARALDLGCGPGTIAMFSRLHLTLAPAFGVTPARDVQEIGFWY